MGKNKMFFTSALCSSIKIRNLLQISEEKIEVTYGLKMYQTSLTASLAQIIALNPFPGNQPARIVGTKWRIKIGQKTSNRGPPPEILDESMNCTGWYSKLLIRQKFRSGAI